MATQIIRTVNDVNEQFIKNFPQGPAAAVAKVISTFYLAEGNAPARIKTLTGTAKQLYENKQRIMRKLQSELARNTSHNYEKINELIRKAESDINTKVAEANQKRSAKYFKKVSKTTQRVNFFCKKPARDLYREGRAEKILSKLASIITPLEKQEKEQTQEAIGMPQNSG